MRVASEVARAARRRPVVSLDSVDELIATSPSVEELVDERRAREVLARLLEALPLDLRIVFVLFEVEELTASEVAAIVGIPVGTATSRLRRAREVFRTLVRRLHAARGKGNVGGRHERSG
jgi:RNA polymerase sigma-70 factor (ECF subfamily)